MYRDVTRSTDCITSKETKQTKSSFKIPAFGAIAAIAPRSILSPNDAILPTLWCSSMCAQHVIRVVTITYERRIDVRTPVARGHGPCGLVKVDYSGMGHWTVLKFGEVVYLVQLPL